MENRDKFLILIVVAWIGAAVFFKSTTDNMFLRMDQLVELQTKHVDNVNKEFRDDLKTLNLQFIGRGKHLRQAQKDIITNVNRIISVTDSLGQSIANLKLDLENFSRDTDQNFSIASEERDKAKTDFESFKRQTRRFQGDLDQRLVTLETDVAALNERVPPLPEEGEEEESNSRRRRNRD